MNKTYAFESYASKRVLALLQGVETHVCESCTTAHECNVFMSKIEKIEDRFNGYLQDMKIAAATEGATVSTLREMLDPAIEGLKGIAHSMGLESEFEKVTDEELNDVKDYIEGAKEIVDGQKETLDGTDDDDLVVTVDEESFFLPRDVEAFEDVLQVKASEFDIEEAFEGYNLDRKAEEKLAMRNAKTAIKEAKKLAKDGDVAGTKKKMNDAIKDLENARKEFLNNAKSGAKISNTIVGNILAAFSLILYDLIMIAMLFAYGAIVGGALGGASAVGALGDLVGKGAAAAGGAAGGALAGGAIIVGSTSTYRKVMTAVYGVLILVGNLMKVVGKKKKGEETTPADYNMYVSTLENIFDNTISSMKLEASSLEELAKEREARKKFKEQKKAEKEAKKATESFISSLFE